MGTTIKFILACIAMLLGAYNALTFGKNRWTVFAYWVDIATYWAVMMVSFA